MPHRLSYWVPVHITEDEFVILSAALTQHGTAEAKALLEKLIASRRPLLEYCPEGTRPPLPNRNEPLEDLPY